MYRGRFAPSPTGLLHFGSIFTAVASYLIARQANGQWLLRIEDLDRPRCNTESTRAILQSLQQLGIRWDGEILYQSQRDAAYQTALEQLQSHLYPCICNRKRLQGRVYDGHCRPSSTDFQIPETAHSWRIRVAAKSYGFVDQLQGHYQQQLDSEIGDFILRRRDGLFAYQLAVVVDDAQQQITDVVRGCDLLDCTPRQIYLQELLGYTTPSYLHLPVLLDENGRKLSKQNHAPPANTEQAVMLLWKVLEQLGQQPPQEVQKVSLARFWEWAIGHWDVRRLPRVQEFPV